MKTNANDTVKELINHAYLKELAADIAKHGGLDGKTIVQAVQEAHARRTEFAFEMLINETERAQIARNALYESIYTDVRQQAKGKTK